MRSAPNFRFCCKTLSSSVIVFNWAALHPKTKSHPNTIPNFFFMCLAICGVKIRISERSPLCFRSRNAKKKDNRFVVLFLYFLQAWYSLARVIKFCSIFKSISPLRMAAAVAGQALRYSAKTGANSSVSRRSIICPLDSLLIFIT